MAGNSAGGGGGRRSGSGSSETKGTGINPHIGQVLTDKTGQRNRSLSFVVDALRSTQ